MISWLESLMNFLKPANNENFIKTTRGKVGRIERINGSTVTISFGSFNINGVWQIKTKVTISMSDILINLTKEQMVRELTLINNRRTNTANR